MTERYISPEVSDWLVRLESALPPAAARGDGTHLGRRDLIDEIGESFAHLMSSGHVRDAVRWFSRGNGDQVGAAIRRAHDAVPGGGQARTANEGERCT